MVRQGVSWEIGIDGKEEAITKRLIVGPFLIGAQVGDTGFDLDDENLTTRADRGNIGAASVRQRQLSDAGEVETVEQAHHAPANDAGAFRHGRRSLGFRIKQHESTKRAEAHKVKTAPLRSGAGLSSFPPMKDDLFAPDLKQFEAWAHEALNELPQTFSEQLRHLVLHVEDFADSEVLKDLEISDPFGLTGLYQGVPLTEGSVMEPSPEPARVFLYRRPILDEWTTRADVGLKELIAHVLIHEIGHHFGWSDEDMDRLLEEAD